MRPHRGWHTHEACSLSGQHPTPTPVAPIIPPPGHTPVAPPTPLTHTPPCPTPHLVADTAQPTPPPPPACTTPPRPAPPLWHVCPQPALVVKALHCLFLPSNSTKGKPCTTCSPRGRRIPTPADCQTPPTSIAHSEGERGPRPSFCALLCGGSLWGFLPC